eukprot:TRINITY_DN6156_c0_g1_i1.p1 TRINITY_DN6156_c0_g1~~TRINITY_DN6156_c0_g1_i1.p1  ORF type:complete len:959 (-),score=164.32 TRINITY_DN6156_c0_g1_i1:199-3075(-)
MAETHPLSDVKDLRAMSLPEVPPCCPGRDSPKAFWGCMCFVPSAVFVITICSLINTLGPQEQMVIETASGTGREVRNGPRSFLLPAGIKRFRRKALILHPLQYAKVRNSRSQTQLRVIRGPEFLWLEPWDEVQGVYDKLVLKAREFTRLVDSFTGEERVEEGPKRIVPDIHESAPDGIQSAYLVKLGETVLVRSRNGSLNLVKNVSLFVPGPKDKVEEIRKPTVIKLLEYAVIKHEREGSFRHEAGPARVILGAYEALVAVKPKILLQKNEYVKLVNKMDGNVRVLKGPDTIVPEPSEDGLDGFVHIIRKAIVVGEQNRVIILNRATGQRELMTEEGIFFPGPDQQILSEPSAIVLRSQEYAVVQNNFTAKYSHVEGPTQLFLQANDVLRTILPKVVLQNQQYVRLLNHQTGAEDVYKGPDTIVPAPEQCEKDYLNNCSMVVEQAIVLRPETSVLVRNKSSALKKTVKISDGEGGIYYPKPYEEILKVQAAVLLMHTQYARVKNLDGVIRHALGPAMLHVEAEEELLNVSLKVVLAKFEFIRLVDEKTGAETITEGPLVFVPEPTQLSIRDENPKASSKNHHTMVQQSTLVDQDHGLVVLDKSTGVQRLVTTEGMWTPAPYEYLVEVREIVRVLPHEAVVVRDYSGELEVHDGSKNGTGTAFFLQPRTEIELMHWTADAMTAEKKWISKIDMRIQRMPFSYTVRTKDHVDFLLMGSVYWRVQDVAQMIRGTKDAPGDVWHHCRSSLMQAVSVVTFDSFMGSFNGLASVAFAADTAGTFYSDRGIGLKMIEVSRFEAIAPETRETLQQINAEVTKQITMLREQEGQNTIKSAKLDATIALQQEQTRGQLELQSEKTKLIEKQTENELIEKTKMAQGDAQDFALHAKAFIEAMNESSVAIKSGVKLYSALKKAEYHNTDTGNLFGPSSAKLFLTSDGVTLNVRDLGLGNGTAPIRRDYID